MTIDQTDYTYIYILARSNWIVLLLLTYHSVLTYFHFLLWFSLEKMHSWLMIIIIVFIGYSSPMVFQLPDIDQEDLCKYKQKCSLSLFCLSIEPFDWCLKSIDRSSSMRMNEVIEFSLARNKQSTCRQEDKSLTH